MTGCSKTSCFLFVKKYTNPGMKIYAILPIDKWI